MDFSTLSKVPEQLRMGLQVSQMHWWSVPWFEIGNEQRVPTDKNLKDWGRANAVAAPRKLSVRWHILLWTFSLLWCGELTHELCSDILDTPCIIYCAYIEIFTVFLGGYLLWLRLNEVPYTFTPNTGTPLRPLFIPAVIAYLIVLLGLLDPWRWGPISFPETSVTSYQSSLCKIPKKRRLWIGLLEFTVRI